MDEQAKGRPVKVKVSDKRRTSRRDKQAPGADRTAGGRSGAQGGEMAAPAPEAAEGPVILEGDQGASGGTEEAERDYLDDLRRVQAEFDNYRKRMLREQTQLAQRASARLIEKLLPVIDNFESAIAHGEGGSGIELVHRELRRILTEEGLEEIEAEGRPFDPTRHEAFQAVEEPEVAEPVVRSVLRRGYSLRGQVIRPAMVSVARPPEATPDPQSKDSERADPEPDAAEG